jgi:hypothetical protein
VHGSAPFSSLPGTVSAGSMKSLMMGGGSGVMLMALGFFSMSTWKNGGSSTPMTVLSMGTRHPASS